MSGEPLDAAALRDLADALDLEKAEAAARLDQARAEISSLSDRLVALERSRFPAVGMRRAVVVALLCLVAGALHYTYSRSRLEICVSDAADESTGADLVRLMSLLNIVDAHSYDHQGERCLSLEFEGVLPPGEKKKISGILDRLIAMKPPARPPSFSLVITEKNPEILRDIELEASAPRVYPLKLDTSDGALRIVNHSFVDVAQCFWEVPVGGKLPRLTHLRPWLGKKKPRSKLSPQLLGTLEAGHEFSAAAPGFEAVTARMILHRSPPHAHILDDEAIQLLVKEQKGVAPAAEAAFREACNRVLLYKSTEAFVAVFLFPTLSRRLTRHDLDETWW